jgi:hypothetical protein
LEENHVKPVFSVAGAVIWIACLSVSHELLAQSATPDSALRVEYGGPIQKEVSVGERLTLRFSLRNAGSRPIAIAPGVRFFVLDAQFAHDSLWDLKNYKIPRDDTWGEVTHLEYPNPEAVYPLPLFVKTLAPGEVYAPTLFDQKSEYAVHFDSVGTYRIRVCAKLENSAVCGKRDIVVKVK